MQILEEELLKVKMREAETVSEMKSLNLKVMQMETEVILNNFEGFKKFKKIFLLYRNK